MRYPRKLFEDEEIISCLQKRGILKQYLKAGKLLISGGSGGLDFKVRKPIQEDIRSFRITKKYRAYGYWRGEDFVVVKIDDHQ